MDRRSFLHTGISLGLAGVTASAGCLGLFETRSALAPPLVENRPSAVYYPTHKEGMKTVGTKRVKGYTVALMYSYPHRFWLMNDDQRNKVSIKSSDSVHLMGSVWDRETKTALPVGNPPIKIRDGDAFVRSKPLWSMLSQNMGYHFGDNIELPGNGTYTVELQFGPVNSRRTGAFRDAFDKAASATFEFDFNRKELEDIKFELLPDKKGKPGALDPMQMKKVPVSQLSQPKELPGRHLGTVTSGDAALAVMAMDQPPKGIKTKTNTKTNNTKSNTDSTYLAVSPRTPYNRYPLPSMSLSATLKRNGTTVFDKPKPLIATLDPDFGYHYGTTLSRHRLKSGDTLRLTVGVPPQVARHEGYETAFIDMPSKELAVP
jgi:hypothetical protein